VAAHRFAEHQLERVVAGGQRPVRLYVPLRFSP
jgi:hypothetical protein